MSTTALAPTALPTGTWTADTLHSSIRFSVRHMVVSTFRGEVPEFSGSFVVGDDGAALQGSAPVASIRTQDPNLDAHLVSPDFFDAENHPELHFASTEIHRDGDRLTVEGELTLRGVAKPITLLGTLSGPVDDPFGSVRLGIALEGTIDRRDYGIEWNAPLPGGGFALGNEVTITADLDLIREG